MWRSRVAVRAAVSVAVCRGTCGGRAAVLPINRRAICIESSVWHR